LAEKVVEVAVLPREAVLAGGVGESNFAIDEHLPLLGLVGEFDGAGAVDGDLAHLGERQIVGPEAAQGAVSCD